MTAHTMTDDLATGRIWMWARDMPGVRARVRRRYTGAHRSGPWTVAALAAAVEAQREADRMAHRASLRRPAPVTPVRFYGVIPAPDAPPAVHVELWMPGDHLRA